MAKNNSLTSEFDEPFVTVILPTYNRISFLKGAIASLLCQDYPINRFEIIIVDNGSSDGTFEWIEHLGKEIASHVPVKFVIEKRKGLVFARHSGAWYAKGNILIFGDDDAIFDPNWISTIVDVYENYPEVGAVGTKILIRWDREPEPWVRKYEDVLGKIEYADCVVVQQDLIINGGSFSIRKDVLSLVGGFNPGQKGDYLVGDSEVGLCKKLQQAGIPVGWTPFTTMWHLQIVDKHGKLKDLKRRFANNGISDAYHDTFYKLSACKVIKNAWQKIFRFLYVFLRAIKRKDIDCLHHDVPLKWEGLFFYLKYLWLYRYDKHIRSEIAKKDWQYNPLYEASLLVMDVN